MNIIDYLYYLYYLEQGKYFYNDYPYLISQ